MKKLFVVAGLLLISHIPGYAQTPPMQFMIEGMVQWSAIDGTLQWSDSDILGSEIDLDGTLSFDETITFAGRAGMIWQRQHEIVLNYRRYDFSESATLNTSLQFGGITIPAGLPLSPDLIFQTLGMYYGYRVIDRPEGFLAIRSGVEFVQYDVSIASTFFGIDLGSLDYEDDQTLPFAFLAGELRVHPFIALGGEISGGWWDEHSAYLVQPMLKVYVYPNVSASIGYSHLSYQNDTENNPFDVTLSGPFIGIQALW